MQCGAHHRMALAAAGALMCGVHHPVWSVRPGLQLCITIGLCAVWPAPLPHSHATPAG